MLKYLLTLYGLWFSFAVQAQPYKISVNEDWWFTRQMVSPDDQAQRSRLSWEPVTLPHTWNSADVLDDDQPGYYRAGCWYRKKIRLDDNGQSRYFLHFEGANQLTTVYLNGKKAVVHLGGYAGFVVPLPDLPELEILVRVDNRFNPAIPPLTADFTFYGGIYRDVFLERKATVHFAWKEGAADLYWNTTEVDSSRARVLLNGKIQAEKAQTVMLRSRLLNRSGAIVTETITPLRLKPGENQFSQQLPAVERPRLWSPDSPYLYTLVAELLDGKEQVLEQYQHALGFRWFRFDANAGFFLNGKPLKLIGSSRHQDYAGLGNAVPDELARKDIALLKAMGGNFLRIAHYPQDPAVLEACDQLGILNSVEIPLVNEITETDSFYRNCSAMVAEMIAQNRNHPSTIIWCSMNEILLKPHYGDDPARQKKYVDRITRLAASLDSQIRKLDPSRYTMIANHGDFNRYQAARLTSIPMLVGWNLYSGWYGGNLKGFSDFLDRHHRELPDKPLLVTEYGADADPRIRATQPQRFDKSIDYALQFHQFYLSEIQKRPFVAIAMVWNLADFNSETRAETMPHINNKGLLEINRNPKDIYWFYQAALAKKPFLRLLGRDRLLQSVIATESNTEGIQEIRTASNDDSVLLLLNGEPQGWQTPRQFICSWSLKLGTGIYHIEVRSATGLQDEFRLNITVIPQQLNALQSFPPLNLLMGARRSYRDPVTGEIWLPGQEYRQGSWGSIGGKPFRMEGNSRLPYGTDKAIRGTTNDPVYQTQLTGIQGYQLKLSPGTYELTLHFAELVGGENKTLAYNLEKDTRTEKKAVRSFDVLINGRLMLKALNLTAATGPAYALAKKMQVRVEPDSPGISIQFRPITGEPVLNALQVIKLD